MVDGPFTETKELIAGYASIQAASKDEAIHWAKRFLEVMKPGESEIRLMHVVAAFDARQRQSAEPATTR